MNDDNKPKANFTEEKSGNPEKYKTITTGVRQVTLSSDGSRQEKPVDTNALREEMREQVGTTAPTMSTSLGEAVSNKNSKAVQYGIVGAGHGGSRLAEQFYQFGYRVCVTNTSQQDLHHINLPANQKYFMDYALGGAGKDMDIGGAAAQECEQDLKQLFESTFGPDCEEVDALVLCVGGGGGCISENAKVFTTFCGLENIKTMYQRVLARTDKFEQPTENGALVDVRDLGIYTNSLNKETGEFEEDQILEVSRHHVPSHRVYTINLKNGTSVTTSDTHPFFSMRKNGQITELNSQQLQPGDLLFTPNIKWPFTENKIVENYELDTDLGWLAGLIAGDGSFVDNTKTLRIYIDDIAIAEKASRIIMKKFGKSPRVQWLEEKSYYELETNREIANILRKILGCNWGSKALTISIPEMFTKSSRQTALAFLAGLIDSDGWVSEGKLNIGSVSSELIKRTTSLFQLLGYSATFSSQDPKQLNIKRDTANWKEFFTARLSNKLGLFKLEIADYLTHTSRKDKLNQAVLELPRKSIPVDNEWIIDSLQKLGLDFKVKDRTIIGTQGKVSLHDLVNKRSSSLTIEKMYKLARLVEEKGNDHQIKEDILRFLTNAENYVEVISIENSQVDCEFYDFSVAKNNNYLAGEGGLTVVHNTGTGSCIPLIQMLSDYEIPITVLYTLPMSSEGTMTKANAIDGLDRLAQLSMNKLINGLIIIDNARIEDLYSGVSLGGFFKVANFDIANIFNTFNTLSSLPSQYTAIDPMDFSRIMTSGNCTIYGKIELPLHLQDGLVHMNEDDIAEVLIQSLQSGLLAEGFNVSEAIRAGVYITGKAEYLNQISASAFNFAFASLNEEFQSADLFKGIYADERQEGKLVIYSLISGVGLPRERIEMLKAQADAEVEVMEEKEMDSKAKMEVFQQTISSDQDKYRQKKKQQSTFGKMARRRRRN